MKWTVFVALVLLCPVPVTDFVVSGGIVPIVFMLSWYLNYLLLPPYLILCCVYCWVFYRLSKILFFRVRWRSQRAGWLAVVAIVGVVIYCSGLPIYVPIAHNTGPPMNVVGLYWAVFSP